MPYRTTFFKPPFSIDALLKTALKDVMVTCVLGACNKMEDIEKSSGWVFFPQFRYNKKGQYVKKSFSELDSAEKIEFYFDAYHSRKLFIKSNKKWFYHCDDYASSSTPDIHLSLRFPSMNPVDDPNLSLSDNQQEMLLLALLTQAKRAGNCYARSCLLAKYLWEQKKAIQRIEIISFNFDHCLVIVNRVGDLNDPLTWGNARIIDSWYPQEGCIYSPNEFIQKAQEVQAFMNKDLQAQDRAGIPHGKKNEPITKISWFCNNEIFPEKDAYPTYSTSPFHPVEDYYDVMNAYTQDLLGAEDNLKPLSDSRVIHENKFKDVLKEIEHSPSLKR